MIVRLTPAAQADVETILDWYNGRGQGLRDQFRQAFDRSLESIQNNPKSCARIHGEIRRALLRQFPYCVFYILESNEVVRSRLYPRTP